MGTCCVNCLATKVRDYASNAQNGAVTVTVIKNPPRPNTAKEFMEWLNNLPKCDICGADARFTVSYFPKKE